MKLAVLRQAALLAAALPFASPAWPQAAATPSQMRHRHENPTAYMAALDDPRRDAYQKPDEVMKALADPDVKAKLAAQGAEPLGSTPEQYGAYLKSEVERWSKVVKATGAKLD